MACATHVLPRFIQGTARPHKHQLRTKLPYRQVALLEYSMYCFDMIRVVSKNGFHTTHLVSSAGGGSSP